MGSHSLLQNFTNPEILTGLLHYIQDLYHMSHQGSRTLCHLLSAVDINWPAIFFHDWIVVFHTIGYIFPSNALLFFSILLELVFLHYTCNPVVSLRSEYSLLCYWHLKFCHKFITSSWASYHHPITSIINIFIS